MMVDASEHRCETCAFWNRDVPPDATTTHMPTSAGLSIGVCLLFPPSLVSTPSGPASLFPTTHADRWCGAWLSEEEGDDPDDSETVVPFRRVA